MKPRNQVDDEKSMKERKVKGEKVVQVAQSVSCAECAIGTCSNTSMQEGICANFEIFSFLSPNRDHDDDKQQTQQNFSYSNILSSSTSSSYYVGRN